MQFLLFLLCIFFLQTCAFDLKKSKTVDVIVDEPTTQKATLTEPSGLFTLEGRVDVLSGFVKASDTQVTLNGGQYTAFPRSNGSFTFRNIPAGSYVLEIHNVEFTFEVVRVDVASRIQASSPSQSSMPYPLVLKPLGRTDYFKKKPVFNPFSFLKNPMVLMMLFMGFAQFALPKMVSLFVVAVPSIEF
jgi:hypothetical protein